MSPSSRPDSDALGCGKITPGGQKEPGGESALRNTSLRQDGHLTYRSFKDLAVERLSSLYPEPEARAIAVRLLTARLNVPDYKIAAEPSTVIKADALAVLEADLSRLAEGCPLQYVLGYTEFAGLRIRVAPGCLIPRPETEELVTRVLSFLRSTSGDNGGNRLVVDVGTGTGAIILSLAKEFPGLAYLGTDVSGDAIHLAEENAAKCSLSDAVKFVVMDGLDDFDEPQCVDVIVSNPPYIKTSVCATLDPRVKDFEPRIALDGGETGLDFYDRYLADAMNLLKPGGAVFFEIGDDQGAEVARLMTCYGFSEIKIEKDFSGHDRYASATLK